MIEMSQEYLNEKKIIQVMSNFTNDIKPEIKRHNQECTSLFENQLKNAIWQARVNGKSLTNNEYYGIVKNFWKKYYIYEI